ncbi:C-type lectin domain family 4 member G-like [Chanodichthys erythropterus]|uniref:C-type lectin domain family 4 member G-like n=1 Tax=Chanodichthys erythropterus TaxID=933992 RepID=UPI00351E4C84
MAEKNQLQGTVESLSQKKLELENKTISLSEELNRKLSKQGFFFISDEEKSWSDSRKYCRDRGADLVIIDTEVKQRHISSFKERGWIGLSDTEYEGTWKWVDNSPLKQGNITNRSGPRTQLHLQDEGKDRKQRGSRRLVLMTVCLGIICVVLLVSIIAQHISNTAERESLFKSYKNAVEEFNQTINRLQHNYTELMTEKDQLKNNFSSLSQKKLELETRVNDLTAEKKQLKGSFDSLSQKKLELERNVTSLSEELQKEKSKGNLCGPVCLFKSDEEKSWSDSRQYCRDRGADLVIINTEEKQKSISSFIKERVWIGLSDIENEGNMTWVDNSTLNHGFWYEEEPNNAGGNEDCVELMPVNTIQNWNDLPCSEKRKGICEK